MENSSAFGPNCLDGIGQKASPTPKRADSPVQSKSLRSYSLDPKVEKRRQAITQAQIEAITKRNAKFDETDKIYEESASITEADVDRAKQILETRKSELQMRKMELSAVIEQISQLKSSEIPEQPSSRSLERQIAELTTIVSHLRTELGQGSAELSQTQTLRAKLFSGVSALQSEIIALEQARDLKKNELVRMLELRSEEASRLKHIAEEALIPVSPVKDMVTNAESRRDTIKKSIMRLQNGATPGQMAESSNRRLRLRLKSM